MIQKAKKLLVIFSICLLTSNLAIFENVEANYNHQVGNFTAFPPISVVSAPEFAKDIKISAEPLKPGEVSPICNTFISQSGSLVQVQDSINLNQSAECFRLAGVRKAEFLAKLEVKPLNIQQIIIVAKSNSIITKENYHQPLSKSQSPIPLIPQIAFVSIVLLAGISVLIKRKAVIVLYFKKSLSLHQLQVLRC